MRRRRLCAFRAARRHACPGLLVEQLHASPRGKAPAPGPRKPGVPRRGGSLRHSDVRCVQEPALAQSLGSYTRLSLQERERWLSETVGETLHVDPAQIKALRMYSSTTDFAKGVAKHTHSVLYEDYVEMEAMQPSAVRRDGNAVCLPKMIALPNGQLH